MTQALSRKELDKFLDFLWTLPPTYSIPVVSRKESLLLKSGKIVLKGPAKGRKPKQA